ncbi:MAG: Maf family protein [Thermodesulfobacteriota bacterium]
MTEEAFILASSSPRRQEMLRLLGLSFQVVLSSIEEGPLEGEGPEEYVLRLCRAKAEEVGSRHPDHWVIGADTVVVLDGVILGKPRDREEACDILEMLQGRSHEVYTGLCVLRMRDGRCSAEAVRTEVLFRGLTRREVEWYVRTGEVLDKAGAYGIQGVAGALIRRIQGSYSNVVGLPLAELVDMLRALGAWDLFSTA